MRSYSSVVDTCTSWVACAVAGRPTAAVPRRACRRPWHRAADQLRLRSPSHPSRTAAHP